MDIYILRDGKKIGPFSEEAVRTLLKQGDVQEVDMACRHGVSDWEPLVKVLETPTPAPLDAAPSDDMEPATAAQIAFLSYFGIVIPAGLLTDAADKLVAGAIGDPKNARRLAMWSVDRLHLYPDLFAAEAQAKMENRAQFFFDLCQTAGADYFAGVTKAHCKVLVDFLDVTFPRWDAKDAEATERYFFPAIAEKFPQLVNKAWRGRFRYGEGLLPPGVRATRKSPTAKLAKASNSPAKAIARGVVLGLCVLCVLYVVRHVMRGGKWGLASNTQSSPRHRGLLAKPRIPTSKIQSKKAPPHSLAQLDVGRWVLDVLPFLSPLHLPARLGLEIDVVFGYLEAAGLQQVGHALAAAHGLFQAVREELDVFLVAVEREAALGDVARQFLVVAFDELKERPPQPHPHDRIDDQSEGIRRRIGWDGFLGNIEIQRRERLGANGVVHGSWNVYS